MANEVAPLRQKMETLRDMLEKARASMAMVVPKHVTPERLIKLALVAASRTPKLLQCTAASVVQAVMQAAQLGLEFGGSMPEGHLVPYGDQCVFIPDYRGLLTLARRSGEIEQIGAWVVYAGDEFSYSNTDEGQKLRHVPALGSKRGEMQLVYAIARLKGSSLPQIECMPKEEIEHIRAKSKAANNGPWVSDFSQMARKTALRRICNYIPRSLELNIALDVEDRAERGESTILGTDMIPEPDEPESRVEGLKAKLAEAQEVTA
jgi:recombination protein RecT